ncbi:MAG TPA: hypothetical protein VN577_07960 [Terriglobales bacterium]|jgi:hypothetical protein|nr:hypothetical protein [Terriglobales bacterium]
MARLSSRRGSGCARGLRQAFSQLVLMTFFGLPAFAQVGGDRVTSFLSNSLSYAQGLGIFGAGFLVMWAVANVARERPSSKQWAGAGGALLLSSVLQLLRTFAG